MSPSKWGPPVWMLFHTLAEKITDLGFQQIGQQLFNHIYRLCNSLPCPDCADHATKFLAKVNVRTLQTKDNLKNLLYVFHNVVNSRKRKTIFHTNNLEIYKKKNLLNVYNNFLQVYHTRGNMRMLTESFQRQRVLGEFKKWFFTNFHFFAERPVLNQHHQNPNRNHIQPHSEPHQNQNHSPTLILTSNEEILSANL
jgi:hypothetical protein